MQIPVYPIDVRRHAEEMAESYRRFGLVGPGMSPAMKGVAAAAFEMGAHLALELLRGDSPRQHLQRVEDRLRRAARDVARGN